MNPNNKKVTLSKSVSKGRTFLLLAAVLLAAAALACQELPDSVVNRDSEPAPTVAPPGPIAAPAEIEVQARLDFPHRADLTFVRAGEVEEILVEPGQRVTAGQILARLNTDHFPALEDEIVRLQTQIVEARDNIRQINKDYADEPVMVAQRIENVARMELANTQAEDFFEDIDRNHDDRVLAATSELDQAKIALEVAEDNLSDTRKDLEEDHEDLLAVAAQAKADAELALDQALERLEDYRENLSDDAVTAADRVTEADLLVDRNEDRLAEYRKDLADNAERARLQVTRAELALEAAEEVLEDFLAEHDRRIIRARTVVGAADAAVDAARAPLTQFLRSPIRDKEVDGKPVDIAKLNSLQAAVDLAEANLKKAEEDLAELQVGPDSLRVQELESNISVAALNLENARKDLAELEEGPDPIVLQELEFSIQVAELGLSRAKDDLSELEEGPDILVLNQLQSRVDTAKLNLDQAEKRLTDAMEGPDALIVPQLELSVTLAQRRLELAERNLKDLVDDGPDRNSVPLMEKEIATRLVQIDELYEGPDLVQLAQIEAINSSISLALERIGDIEEEMEETLLRAPFDGLIVLLNVAEDDRVSKNSRVMELLDPSQVKVDGFVDASFVKHISVGTRALVEIDTLPGRQLEGQITFLERDPRTERGVISHAVEIQFDLPEDAKVPVRLSAVDAVLIP